jgi:hypothetical protein
VYFRFTGRRTTMTVLQEFRNEGDGKQQKRPGVYETD